MADYPVTFEQAAALAEHASEAIRALNHVTLAADGGVLRYPCDAYTLLGSLSELVERLPQLLEQIAAFLVRQLQFDILTINGGQFDGDPLAAIGTAGHALE